MTRITIALTLVALALGACHNDHLTASGEQPDAGQTNDNQNTNDNTNNNQSPSYEVTCTLTSSDQIAVWLETEGGDWVFGPTYTVEDCPEGPAYRLDFNPTGIFVVSASNDLSFTCNVNAEMYWIDGDPAQTYNFWDFRRTLNNLWLLPAYWEFNFFPEDEGEAEGFELAASAFICALDLDMLNLGCDGEIVPDFFLYDGTKSEGSYAEGDYMPILMFGLIEDLNKSRRTISDAPPRVTRL